MQFILFEACMKPIISHMSACKVLSTYVSMDEKSDRIVTWTPHTCVGLFKACNADHANAINMSITWKVGKMEIELVKLQG